MEYIDVLDDQGQKTGLTKSRNDIHRDGDWHAAAHVWLINPRSELLIQRRSASKDVGANKWDISAAGHVEAGSTTRETAFRETNEELGIEILEEEMELIFTTIQEKTYPDGLRNREFNDVFLVSKDIPLSDFRIQELEISELRYLPWRELQGHIDAHDPAFISHPNEYEQLFGYLLHQGY